mgnify:CR=1 FL=1
MTKPDYLLDEHLYYLDDLRESGETNMWGSPAFLRDEYPDLTKQQSFAIVQYWMNTFSDRHKAENKINT